MLTANFDLAGVMLLEIRIRRIAKRYNPLSVLTVTKLQKVFSL